MEPLSDPPGERARATEGAIGFLEVQDRQGHVVERVRITALPVSVGRAYDNDVIIGDPYVCPHHLRLRRDEQGRVVAEDLGSRNGLYEQGSRRPSPSLALSPGNQMRIGHTQLRYRDVGFEVPPAIEDRHPRKLLGALESGVVQAAFFIGALAVLWVSSYMGSVERREATEPVLELAFPIALLVVWAAGWAFVGRLVVHRVKFLVHCAIACGGLGAVYAFDTVLDYAAFSLSLDDWRTAMSVVAGVAVVTVVLYAHLRFCTLHPPWRVAATAGAVSVSLVALMLLKAQIDATEFSAVPKYHATLKAPMFRLSPMEPPDAFFARLDRLRDEVLVHARTTGD